MLVGDSIRLSYAPIVTKQLDGKAVVVSPKANGGDSSNVLSNLEKKLTETGKFQVSPGNYESNLRTIVERIRKETGAIVLFATTTPILDERAAAARKGRDYQLLEESVVQYNAIANKVMHELKVPVNDLHEVLSKPISPDTTETLIGDDGVHMTGPGKDLLGQQVAVFLENYLSPEQE